MYRVDVAYGRGMVTALISSFCAVWHTQQCGSQRATSLSVSASSWPACTVLGPCSSPPENGRPRGEVAGLGVLLLLGLIATSLAFNQ